MAALASGPGLRRLDLRRTCGPAPLRPGAFLNPLRLRILAVLGLAMLATACVDSTVRPIENTHTPCQPLVIVPPANVTVAELLSIDDAIELWHGRGAPNLTREEVPGAPHVPLRFETAAGMFYGIYLDHVGELVINTTLTDRRERAITIAHELGHVMGLVHIARTTRTSLMNTGNLVTPPQPSDTAALAVQWGACPPAAP